MLTSRNNMPALWQPTIPKYNAPPPSGLEFEHEYIYKSDGKVYKKGAMYRETFRITQNVDHFSSPYGITETMAKEEALEYILSVYENVYVYWWGTNHKNPKKHNMVIVKYRHLHRFSRHEEMEFLNRLGKQRLYPPGSIYGKRARNFAQKKKGEINPGTSFLKVFQKFLNQYISFEI